MEAGVSGHLGSLPLLPVAVQRIHREPAIPRRLRKLVAISLLRRKDDLQREQSPRPTFTNNQEQREKKQACENMMGRSHGEGDLMHIAHLLALATTLHPAVESHCHKKVFSEGVSPTKQAYV